MQMEFPAHARGALLIKLIAFTLLWKAAIKPEKKTNLAPIYYFYTTSYNTSKKILLHQG